MVNVTTTSPMPNQIEEDIIRKYRCDFLHKKIPIFDSRTNKIIHYCKECADEQKKMAE